MNKTGLFGATALLAIAALGLGYAGWTYGTNEIAPPIIVRPVPAVHPGPIVVLDTKKRPKPQVSATSTSSQLAPAGAPNPTPTPPSIPRPAPASTASSVCNTSLIETDTGFDISSVIGRGACSLVNSLYAAGHATGNSGDTYDNRDNLHVNLCEDWSPNPECPVEHRLFPQHSWLFSGSAGARTDVRPGITVGQASWAGFTSNDNTHNIAHKFYLSQSGADELYRQYTHDNIYVYPSLDDDKFATGGNSANPAVMANPLALDRATLNIANTPYVISSSQIAFAGTDYYHIHNASGSDLPFVKIILLGLASLRPDVKQALRNGPTIDGNRLSFLIPTLQMLIRHAHRSITNESDYLSSPIVHRAMYMAHYLAAGRPQPQYDSEKLTRLANSLTLADIPPLVRLTVASEDFGQNERLFDTPGAIARDVPTGVTRAITVSAAGSMDLDGSSGSHEYVWRLLDSDPAKASIAVDPHDQSRATISFSTGPSVDRIDVGVFVRRAGQPYYSVPGIISVHVHS